MDVLRGCLHIGCKFANLACCFCGPVGQTKDCLDCWPADRNGSVGVPMLEVVLLSKTVKGID